MGKVVSSPFYEIRNILWLMAEVEEALNIYIYGILGKSHFRCLIPEFFFIKDNSSPNPHILGCLVPSPHQEIVGLVVRTLHPQIP